MSAEAPPPTPVLAPLPYHREIVAYLRSVEPELWQWASSSEVQQGWAEQVRTELLKSHYRLEAAGHPELVQRCATVAARLGVTAPITLYQANGGFGLNAMLCHLPGEAHIVFTGPILSTLRGAELDAVLAHELAHFLLWELDAGDFLVAHRLLQAAVDDPRTTASQAQSARRFRLYTEVFADRGSFAGCQQELEATIATLIKTETGLSEVSAASYLRQADEIFARESGAVSKGAEHPETFIRARALRLWSEGDPGLEAWLTRTIDGPLALDALDLAGQQRLVAATRRLLAQLLRPRWFQTAAALAHARAYLADFQVATGPDKTLPAALLSNDPATREYLCYVLLDFTAIDPELEDLPLAAALEWAEKLALQEPFQRLALKELSLGKRELNKVKKHRAALLEQAARQAELPARP